MNFKDFIQNSLSLFIEKIKVKKKNYVDKFEKCLKKFFIGNEGNVFKIIKKIKKIPVINSQKKNKVLNKKRNNSSLKNLDKPTFFYYSCNN